MTKVKTSIRDDSAKNINAAQKKQKRYYDRRHISKTEIRIDDMVLMKNTPGLIFNKKYNAANLGAIH